MKELDIGYDINSLLRHGKALLKEHNTEAYLLCAELLLMHAADLSRVRVLTEPEYIISEECAQNYLSFLDRCAANEPVQYIIGKCEFMSLDFYVNPAVLIPRPDTEILVGEALSVMADCARVLEIGTGSGCIAVSLAKYAPGIIVTAIDISPAAVETAKKNAALNGVCESIEFILGDVKDVGDTEPSQKYDMLISNPPYIKTEDIMGLGKNVKDYEPHLALDGGTDGLEFYRVICKKSRCMLKSGGVLLFEIGADQACAVWDIMQNNGYSDIWVKKDLAGHDRVVGARLCFE